MKLFGNIVGRVFVYLCVCREWRAGDDRSAFGLLPLLYVFSFVVEGE